MPSARVDATAIVQNASLISNRSMSPIAMPARSSALGMASVGASPVRSGSIPTEAHDTMRASGTSPWAAA